MQDGPRRPVSEDPFAIAEGHRTDLIAVLEPPSVHTTDCQVTAPLHRIHTSHFGNRAATVHRRLGGGAVSRCSNSPDPPPPAIPTKLLALLRGKPRDTLPRFGALSREFTSP